MFGGKDEQTDGHFHRVFILCRAKKQTRRPLQMLHKRTEFTGINNLTNNSLSGERTFFAVTYEEDPTQ
jgi:hypothetical protein